MKNAILLLLISTSLIFSSCKKDEVVNPNYAGNYSSGSTAVISGTTRYSIQYNAIVSHNVATNRASIKLFENYKNLSASGTIGTLIDTYTYQSPEFEISDSKSTLDSPIVAINKKKENVGKVLFDGTITYTATDMIYRGKISGVSITIILNKIVVDTSGW